MLQNSCLLADHLLSLGRHIAKDLEIRKQFTGKHRYSSEAGSIDPLDPVNEEIEVRHIPVKALLEKSKTNSEQFERVLELALKDFNSESELLVYQFTGSDLCVIAQFYTLANADYCLNLDLKQMYFRDQTLENYLARRLNYICSLIRREILSLEGSNGSDTSFELRNLIKGTYSLNNRLMDLLLGWKPTDNR